MSTPIKFAFLLPTKNRLDLLKHAIQSVCNQTYPHWELIVSDNFSEEDVKGYVESLDDARVKYYRTDKPLSVTDNWNNAQNHADGDYYYMLGDDDAILPNFCERCLHHINTYNSPELLCFPAYLYTQKDVHPEHPNGFIFPAQNTSPLWKGHTEPYFLRPTQAHKMVQNSICFNVQIPYNSQYYLYNKSLVESLRKYDTVYVSPYPDYYTTNAMFMLAKSILCIPEHLSVIGVTPKSYGFFYLRNREEEGMAFHNHNNFRDELGEDLRKKLCNVAVMETAGAVTYLKLIQRLSEFRLKFDFISYYQAVIRRIVNDYSAEEANAILQEEVFSKNKNEDKENLMLYFKQHAKIKILTQNQKATAKTDTESFVPENISQVVGALARM